VINVEQERFEGLLIGAKIKINFKTKNVAKDTLFCRFYTRLNVINVDIFVSSKKLKQFNEINQKQNRFQHDNGCTQKY